MEQKDSSKLIFKEIDFTDILPKIKEITSKEESLDSKRNLVLGDILYNDEYKQLMDIFNTLLNLKEYSERAYVITNEVIETIPAYYTAWCYKLDIVLNLQKNLQKELLWLDEFSLENPKNYQIWSYRIELLKKFIKDKTFSNDKVLLKNENIILKLMIEEDSKNHHVWGYKSWLMNFLKLDLEDLNLELEYSDFLLREDVLNNSAWAFRYNILTKIIKIADNESDKIEIYKEELDYARDKIDVYPDNVSSWNYYFRIIEILSENKLEKELIDYMISLCEEYLNTTSYALEYYCKLLVLVNGDKDKVKDMYILLRDHRDPIRKIYWNYKLSQL
ncbi:protein prenylyltransferase [Hanseniaspora valbyensis NRRL Y-1626]|uniref:Protein farnesyltransferase/geranylgeranyltransferase type-1 subunit alpha n=1 Tax=Hanseniaspora valbyensis NRRL Y-1626 TaxID=766949 RepID=A0A1B7TAK3_9ASCO|nr:protein prenylyltransferase [Hanseniaspora valbyensis NRRL Y-1626]